MPNRQKDETRLTEAETFEQLRLLLAKRRLFKNLFVISIPSAIFIMILPIALGSVIGADAAGIGFLLAIVLGIVFIVFSYVMKHKYMAGNKGLIGRNIVHGMLTKNFELIKYEPEQCFDAEQLQEAELLLWNTYSGNDYFKAKYRGVTFQFSDIELLVKAQISRHGRNSARMFAGQWLIIDLNKTINPPLIVSELNNKSLVDDRSKVQMENVDFNKQFNVLTKDPHIAFYVLTPHFMDFILSARQRAYGRKHMYFTGKCMHIAIYSSRDAFEPRYNENDLSMFKARIQHEIDNIKDMLDELILNEHLFNPRLANNRTPSVEAVELSPKEAKILGELRRK